jgi:hypothetical protein
MTQRYLCEIFYIIGIAVVLSSVLFFLRIISNQALVTYCICTTSAIPCVIITPFEGLQIQYLFEKRRWL